jgi:diacylglycerol kinase family enzyme
MFVQMLGVGFDAHVVHRISLPMKRLLGRTAYVLQGLRELGRYPYTPIRLRLDGQETEASSLVVSKGRLYAGPYTLAPHANHAEPGFHVALFQGSGPVATMIYGTALSLDAIAWTPGLRLVRASRIEILGESLPVQADGDPIGYSPLSISDAPSSLRVVVE